MDTADYNAEKMLSLASLKITMAAIFALTKNIKSSRRRADFS